MNWIRIYSFVYIVLVCVFLAFYVQNISTTHTWFANLGAPGSTLVSFRGTFVDVTIRLAIISHVIISGIILVKEDNIYAFYGYILFMLLTLLGVVGMGTAYGSCNTYFGNVCNDLLYCCKYPGNGCPTVIPCPSSYTLGPNETFLGLFWINFVLFLLQLGYVIYIGIWKKAFINSSVDKFKNDLKMKKEDEEEDAKPPPPLPSREEEEEEKKPPLPPPPTQISNRLHGLRKKIKL